MGRVALFLALPGMLAAQCTGSNDAGWVRFNADEQALTVAVGDGAPVEPVTLTLLSTTSTVEVGNATVTPGGGPVGTEHQILVNVLDEYEETVGRVTVVTAGERGTQTHLLVQDSADPGRWQMDITSLGAGGETREDQFTVRLWRAAAEDEEPDPEAEVEDSET